MRDSTSQPFALAAISLCTVLLTAVFCVYCKSCMPEGLHSLKRQEVASAISLCAIVSFWLVYFNAPKLRIATFRQFLDESTFRLKFDEPNEDPPPDYAVRNDALRQRANANIVSQGIFMTVVSMLVGPILNNTHAVSEYGKIIQHIIPLLAMLTLAFLLWSIDLLDTAQNVFKGAPVDKLQLMVYFFRGVGGHGASAFRFYGFALLSIFMFAAMSFYEPIFTAIAVAVFVSFGYPILFGYKGHFDFGAIKDVKIDKDCGLPVRTIFAVLFIIGLWGMTDPSGISAKPLKPCVTKCSE